MNTTTLSLNVTDNLNGLIPGKLRVSVGHIPLTDLGLRNDLWKPLPEADCEVATIHPLVVQTKENGTFAVLDGYKRLEQLQAQNTEHALCTVIHEDLDRLQSGLVRLALNAKRPTSTGEAIVVLRWLFETLSDPALVPRVVSLLSFTGKKASGLIELAQNRDDDIEPFKHNVLDLERASDFLRLAPDDRQAFLHFFESVRLSAQYQREFLQWLPEISYARNISVSEILQSEELQHARSQSHATPNQRIQMIRDALFNRRFPRYAETLSKWSATVRKVNPDPSRVTFSASPAFEKRRLDMNIRIDDPDGMPDLFRRLAAIEPSLWSTLIDPIE